MKLPIILILNQWLLTSANFMIVPSSNVVVVGETASFRCRHQSRNTFWLVNGTELVVGNPPPSITPDIIIDEDGIHVNTLNIVGKPEYNGTTIQCGTSISEVTPYATLLVQGFLGEVSNITQTLTTISWIAPFSLNLTNIEPDIVYCVDVYNITCGGRSHVISDCNVTEPRFSHNSLQLGYIYNITVTPRSNVDGASNGTSFTKEETFVLLNEPTTILQYGIRNNQIITNIYLILNKTIDAIEPATYFLMLFSADGVTEIPRTQTLSTNFTNIGSSMVVFNVELFTRRLWDCKVLAFNCSEHTLLDSFELSTHEFQNISVISTTSGGFMISGEFVFSSEAVGVLIITYSLTNDSDRHYSFVARPPGDRNKSTSLNIRVLGLFSDQYNVSIFVVEENRLPFSRSATRPISVSVIRQGTGVMNITKYELQSTSTGVCVNCTYLDSSISDCVAVVHQRISQLSSSGLMNIESSHKFTKSGDTAYGCIGVDLEQYQVGVFASHTTSLKPSIISKCKWCRNAGSHGAAVIIGITLGIILTLAIVFIRRHAKVSQTNANQKEEPHIEMQTCGAYEITKPVCQPHQWNLAIDDNPI